MDYSYEPIPDVESFIFRTGRMAANAFAHASGYFFLPCPLCGINFGGYEWETSGSLCSSIPTDKGSFSNKGICPWCTEAGRGCLVRSQILGYSCSHLRELDE